MAGAVKGQEPVGLQFDMQILLIFRDGSPVAADAELDSSCRMHDELLAHSKLC